VALDGQGFCKKIGSIKGAAAELDVELVLADAVDDPIETHVDRFAPLGANGLGSEADGTLVVTPNESRRLGITEGVENLSLVDTYLGVGEKACIFRLGNSSANHRYPRAVAENRSVVEGRVGGAQVVVATGGGARVWAVEVGGVGIYTEDHVGRVKRENVVGVAFGITEEAEGGFEGGFGGLGLGGG